MTSRSTISPDRFHELRGAVPAPRGYSWQWDPAASGDRLRLFPDGRGRDIVIAYASGDWAINSPDPAVYLTDVEKLRFLANRVETVGKSLGFIS